MINMGGVPSDIGGASKGRDLRRVGVRKVEKISMVEIGNVAKVDE